MSCYRETLYHEANILLGQRYIPPGCIVVIYNVAEKEEQLLGVAKKEKNRGPEIKRGKGKVRKYD